MAYLRKNVGTVTGIVTQEELDTSTEDVRQDLTALALREAITENRVANNLPNSFIDQFQDSTGIDSHTQTLRTTLEYCGCIGGDADGQEFDYEASNSGSGLTMTEVGSWNMSTTQTVGGSGNSTPLIYSGGASHWAFSGGTVDVGFYIDYLTSYNWTDIAIGKNVTWGDITRVHLSHSDDAITWTDFNLTGASQESATFLASGTDSCDLSTFSSAGVIDWSGFSSTAEPNNVINKFGGWSSSVSKRYLKLIFKVIGTISGSNYNAGYSAFQVWYKPVFATGTVFGNANVPSSAQTKVSGVMLYKDGSGTATIGTDLKVYFTCNGGTNWTETTSYTTVSPVFSTGIIMVKLGETTCTTGSDVRYKAVWANQADGSKDTQLHGIGLNY